MKNTLFKRKTFLEKCWLLGIFSWLIPGCIFLLSMSLIGAAPFGDETILLRDSVGQYIDYINYFKTVLKGENNLFYSFSKVLGGDMLGLASYYLLSPFNLLFLFSTNESIPMLYTTVVVLKLSMCGATFYWSVQSRFGAKYSHLIFSTAYALMAYNVLYEWNIMWLDGVIILPLLGVGIERIWENKSPILYTCSLAYGLLTNFYIGYMLCIASVLFCFARLILHMGSFRERFILIIKYLLASVAGGFGTAFVWLPAFLTLRKGRSQFDRSIFSLELNFDPWELASKLVAGAGGPDQLGNGLPHIFCGTVVLFLAILFFFSSKIPLRTRAAALSPVLVVTASFFFRFTDVAWHGFSPNNSFNYRYSFIWSYLLITIAQYAIHKKLLESFSERLAAAIPLALVYLFLLIKDYYYVPTKGIAIAIIVLMFCLFWGKCFGQRKFAGLLLCVVTAIELTANCFFLLNGVVGEVWTLRISKWMEQIPVTTEAVEYVKQHDSEFYRMEKTFHRSHNDAMFFSYNGLTHFSSAGQPFVPRFIEKMGMRNFYGIWAYYNTGSTAEVDSLLGVKYVLSKTDLSAPKGYELLTQIEDIRIYKNPNALPLAFIANPHIYDVSMDSNDYFALHNDIWTGICGTNKQVLHPINTYSVTLVNLQESVDSNNNTVYTPIDKAQEALLRYEITVSENMPLYYYFSAPGVQDTTVRVNGQDHGVYFDTYRWDISSAGTYQPGDTVTIELVLNADKMVLQKSYFYYEDLQALEETVRSIKSSQVVVRKQSSSCLSGQITADQDGYVVFTIPYDQGWQLYLDGKQTQIEKVLDTFISAQIMAGTHSFTMRYVPQGFYAGCELSLFTLVAVLLYAFLRKRSLSFANGKVR